MSLTAAALALMMGTAAPEAIAYTTVDAPAPPAAMLAQTDAPQPSVRAIPVTLPPYQSTEIPVLVQVPATGDPAAPASTTTVPPVDGAAAAGAASPAGETQPSQVGKDGVQSVTHGSDILVTHRRPAPPGDPLQQVNIESFKAVQAVDKAVLEPVATAYNKGIPRPIRQGMRNFFTNLEEPVVFAAFLLELKPGKAVETAGRFLINTTLGVAGLMDVAKRKPFHLPYRPNGMADVLGYYGVGPGPYMYLPLVGPTTVRDLIGDSVDQFLSPSLLGKPFTKLEVAIPMSVLNQLGSRAAFDEEIGRIRKSDNPYATYRELYLRQRKAEIDALHGRPTPPVVPVYGPGLRAVGGKESRQGADEGTADPATAHPTDAQPADAHSTGKAIDQGAGQVIEHGTGGQVLQPAPAATPQPETDAGQAGRKDAAGTPRQ